MENELNEHLECTCGRCENELPQVTTSYEEKITMNTSTI